MREDQRVSIERLVASAFGGRVGIIGETDLGGDWAPVWRLSLDNGSTVVVKTRREESGPWGGEAAVLDNERRGLELVTGLGIDVAPRLLAADEELGIVVMTDVGTGPSVQDLLFGESAADATAGLVGLAHTTGILHAESAGIDRQRQWRERTTFLDRTFQFWPDLRDAAATLGFAAPVGVSSDLEALESDLADPRFRVFVHGDLGPNNAVSADGHVRLVDFEGSGFRHLALDAASLRLPFPAYGHWAVLPARVISAMDEAYRVELSRGWAGALDDEVYEAGIATGSAAWAIIRAHRLPLIASSGQPPGLAVRRSTQIVQTLTSFAAIALRTGRFEALACWFRALTQQMRSAGRRPRQPPRVFPPFAGQLERGSGRSWSVGPVYRGPFE